MEENNRKGPGIFYAVTGVATLVVAIIGATFAYFTASAGQDVTDKIQGTTASVASIGLAVEKVAPTTEALDGKPERLVPLTSESQMTKALAASCVDDAGYTACQVYEIRVTSTAAENVIATPTVQLVDENGVFSNLKWKKLTGTTATDFAVDAGFNTVEGTTKAPIGDYTINSSADGVSYFVVWLEEAAGENQAEAAQTFKGTVSVTAVDALGNQVGGQLTATFS